MFVARFRNVKGCFEVEDGAPVLDRDDSTRRERAPILGPVDLIKNGSFGITGPQKIGVEGMCESLLDGSTGGYQRLAEHLPSEYSLRAALRTATAKEIHFEVFEVEKFDQCIERYLHSEGPIWGDECVARSPGCRECVAPW